MENLILFACLSPLILCAIFLLGMLIKMIIDDSLKPYLKKKRKKKEIEKIIPIIQEQEEKVIEVAELMKKKNWSKEEAEKKIDERNKLIGNFIGEYSDEYRKYNCPVCNHLNARYYSLSPDLYCTCDINKKVKSILKK